MQSMIYTDDPQLSDSDDRVIEVLAKDEGM